MNWFNIIKNPKLRVGSKVTTNLSSTSDNQPDEPCKKKLLEYREKLKNTKGLLTNLDTEAYAFDLKQGRRESKYGGIITEEIEFYLDDTSSEASFDKLPEEVACKALKLLSEISGNDARLSDKQIGDNYWCEVTRKIITGYVPIGSKIGNDEFVFFEFRLIIMTDNIEGPVVIDLGHELYVPYDEMRTNITHHSMLLDKMDWR